MEGRRDHIVEATTIGTAIARFARSEQQHSLPTLAIMSLDPQRRQAARIDIRPDQQDRPGRRAMTDQEQTSPVS